MTLHYSQEQWLTIIDRARKELLPEHITYRVPALGTVEFAKFIDHTLLKLDANEEQIHQLCDEATRCDFKVGLPLTCGVPFLNVLCQYDI